MFSFEDCATLCGLDEDQIAAVAEHEHVPAIEAMSIVRHLLSQPAGAQEIRGMFVDLIQNAVRRHRITQAAELLCAFWHVLKREAVGVAA